MKKTITTKQVSDILKEYNLTADQFSLIYKSEISQAGKILNVQSRLVKAIEGLDEAGFSTMTGREARELSKNVVGGSKNVTKQLLKDIDLGE